MRSLCVQGSEDCTATACPTVLAARLGSLLVANPPAILHGEISRNVQIALGERAIVQAKRSVRVGGRVGDDEKLVMSERANGRPPEGASDVAIVTSFWNERPRTRASEL